MFAPLMSSSRIEKGGPHHAISSALDMQPLSRVFPQESKLTISPQASYESMSSGRKATDTSNMNWPDFFVQDESSNRDYLDNDIDEIFKGGATGTSMWKSTIRNNMQLKDCGIARSQLEDNEGLQDCTLKERSSIKETSHCQHVFLVTSHILNVKEANNCNLMDSTIQGIGEVTNVTLLRSWLKDIAGEVKDCDFTDANLCCFISLEGIQQSKVVSCGKGIHAPQGIVGTITIKAGEERSREVPGIRAKKACEGGCIDSKAWLENHVRYSATKRSTKNESSTAADWAAAGQLGSGQAENDSLSESPHGDACTESSSATGILTPSSTVIQGSASTSSSTDDGILTPTATTAEGDAISFASNESGVMTPTTSTNGYSVFVYNPELPQNRVQLIMSPQEEKRLVAFLLADENSKDETTPKFELSKFVKLSLRELISMLGNP